MSGTLTWNIAGCDVTVEREEIDAVRIQTAESQTEVRTALSTALRYLYKFRIIGRLNVSGTNEVGVIRTLYQSNLGAANSFSMTDPLDGAGVTCRFASPLKMKRIMPTSPHGAWWELTFEVITVVNPT